MRNGLILGDMATEKLRQYVKLAVMFDSQLPCCLFNLYNSITSYHDA